MTVAQTTIEPNCPSCGYCLRGLPSRARCPECGNPFEILDLSIEDICANFECAIPAHERMFMRIGRIDRRFPWAALAVFVVGSLALTGLFVGAQVLATKLGFEYPGYRFRSAVHIRNFLGESATWWARIEYDNDYMLLTGMWVTTGHIIAAAFVWLLYLCASRRVRHSRWIVRRLGLRVLGSIWTFVAPAMVLVSIWQFVNVSLPFSFGTWDCGPRGILRRLTRGTGLQPDFIQLTVLVGLIGIGVLVGLYTISRHRAALSEVIAALNGVRGPATDQSDNLSPAAEPESTSQ